MSNNKVLNLNLSRTERAFEENESLWESEIVRILKLINKHVDTLNSLDHNMDIDKQPLLSVGIFGSPGSGKSSLLRTLTHRARRDDNEKESLDSNKFARLHSLEVIKPAPRSKFLYAFLAAALKEDRDIHGKQEDRFRNAPVLSRIQQSFQEVSEYLQVIDAMNLSHEDDPLGKSLERLEWHESGIELIDKMNLFIDELVKMMTKNKKGQRVVLLPVDDADMSSETLWPTLDTYWRYLKHPQLVPIFTFTGRLAEELIREEFERKLELTEKKKLQ